MNAAATARLLPRNPESVRLPLSLTASIVIHALLLIAAATLLRAMPATLVRDGGPNVLTANLIALPPLNLEPALPLDMLDPPAPMPSMLPTPEAPPARVTPLAGVSVAPATIQVDAEFAPVGKISYGVSDGVKLFGPDLRTQMAERYAQIPARPPRLNGTISVMYPIKGAMAGKSLALTALLMIDQAGRITEARVLPDDPVFVAAVLVALKNAVFYPAQIDGNPIPYWTVVDFNFTIDGPTGPDGKRLDR
jgi:hypothetical protein